MNDTVQNLKSKYIKISEAKFSQIPKRGVQPEINKLSSITNYIIGNEISQLELNRLETAVNKLLQLLRNKHG